MRPEKFRRLVNKAFETWLAKKDNTKFMDVLPEMKRVWFKLGTEEGDFRTGFETYGYDDVEDIDNNMMYISDRWRCAFRLKWLIDGLENGRI